MFFFNNPSLSAIEGQAGFLDGNPLAAASLLSDTFVDGRNPVKPVDIAFLHCFSSFITQRYHGFLQDQGHQNRRNSQALL